MGACLYSSEGNGWVLAVIVLSDTHSPQLFHGSQLNSLIFFVSIRAVCNVLQTTWVMLLLVPYRFEWLISAIASLASPASCQVFGLRWTPFASTVAASM